MPTDMRYMWHLWNTSLWKFRCTVHMQFIWTLSYIHTIFSSLDLRSELQDFNSPLLSGLLFDVKWILSVRIQRCCGMRWSLDAFEAVGSRMQSLPEMPIGFNIVHFVVFSALHGTLSTSAKWESCLALTERLVGFIFLSPIGEHTSHSSSMNS